MRIKPPRWKGVIIAGASLAVVAACAVGGYDGYAGGDVDVGYVGGYYEPCCYDYGGWGGRYRVGPPRGGVEHGGGEHGGGAHPSPGGHPVGGGRPAPSIPGRPRR
jgi:hypothetical protein